jgi:hypothetical protein
MFVCPEHGLHNHDWVPHGQLKINFDCNVIQFPDGRTVTADMRYLELLVAIPPEASLSLEEIATKITKQREAYRDFLTASDGSEYAKKGCYRVKMTASNLRKYISGLNELTTEYLIQHESTPSHYRLAPQYC